MGLVKLSWVKFGKFHPRYDEWILFEHLLTKARHQAGGFRGKNISIGLLVGDEGSFVCLRGTQERSLICHNLESEPLEK
jgi:hypothetical protein